MQTAIPSTLMRGGTSKGLYFHANDLPSEKAERDAILLAAMGSPDPRQIDGIGGAHPLTSKIAVLSKSASDETDIDYLFLQVSVDTATVSAAQNCGNILAGVGPWAVQEGLVPVQGDRTTVRIRMLNSDGIAFATFATPDGEVQYAGNAAIDGVPGTAAPISIGFRGTAGATCGSLFPTGNRKDEVQGLEVTCIDNGMPVILLRAEDLGLTGEESPQDLEANPDLKTVIECIRLALGPEMGLGDVREKTVPKMSIISPPQKGGFVSTRTFIPHRVHQAVGVLGAVSVATACLVEGTIADALELRPSETADGVLNVEHPTGAFQVEIELDDHGDDVIVRRSALMRTARRLMKGDIFVPTDLGARS